LDFYQCLPSSRDLQHIRDTGNVASYRLRKRAWHAEREVEVLPPPVRLCDKPVDAVSVRMGVIEACQEAKKEKQHQAAGNAERKAGNSDSGVTDITLDIAQGYRKVVPDHRSRDFLFEV